MRWVWVGVVVVVGVAVATGVAVGTPGTGGSNAAPVAGSVGTAPTPADAGRAIADAVPATGDVTAGAAEVGPATGDVTAGAADTAPETGGTSDPVTVDANATYAAGSKVTVTISGTQSRQYAIYLYDSRGDVAATKRVVLSNATQPISFGSLPADSYRVLVHETYTANEATATFGVGGAYEPGVVPEVTLEQPADVVRVPIALPNDTTRATFDLGNDSTGYRVRGTLVDRDGDGVVTLAWNTFYAGHGGVAVRATGADTVENASRARDLDGYLPEARYELAVRAAGGDRESDGGSGGVLDRGTIVLRKEPLHSTLVDVYEAPVRDSPAASFDARVASSDVEADEWAFVVVHTEGVYGAVNSTADLRSVGPDQVMLTIEPRDDGTPIRLTAADYLAIEDGRIVIGFGPGNDALEPLTAYRVTFRVTAGHPYAAGESTTEANLNVVRAGSEPDRPVVEISRVDAPREVEPGATANVTVTLVNQGERTGTVTVTVAIAGEEATREVEVVGQASTTVDVPFDTGRVLEGNRTYAVSANDSRVTGSIQIGTVDDGPTLVAGERNDSALPGFTAATAFAALAIALAIARHRRA